MSPLVREMGLGKVGDRSKTTLGPGADAEWSSETLKGSGSFDTLALQLGHDGDGLPVFFLR